MALGWFRSAERSLLRPVIVLSHRGYWRHPSARDSVEAIARSFSSGFRVETAVRDRCGGTVVSHDPAEVDAPDFERVIELQREFSGGPLAINVKADGLQPTLANALDKERSANYLLVDMSIPDALGYVHAGLRFFTRQSEHKPEPHPNEQAFSASGSTSALSNGTSQPRSRFASFRPNCTASPQTRLGNMRKLEGSSIDRSHDLYRFPCRVRRDLLMIKAGSMTAI